MLNWRNILKKLNPAVKLMSLKEKQALLKDEMALINKKFKREVVTFGYDKVQGRIPFNSAKLNEKTGGGVPCFGAGTKVLMSNYTSKNIEDIRRGDCVFAFNENDYRLEKSFVTKTFKNKTDEIVYLKSDKSEVTTTKEHPFLVTHNGDGERLWSKAINLNKESCFYYIPQEERTYEWKKGWLLGALISDGHIDKYSFTFYNKNKVLIYAFIAMVKEVYSMKCKISNYRNNNTLRVNVCSIGIVNVLTKQLEDIKNIVNRDFIRGYLAGYFDGDGGLEVNGVIKYYSSDKKNLDILSMLLRKLDFKSSLFKMSGSRISTLKGKQYASLPEFSLSVNKTLKWLFTCCPITKNETSLSLHKKTIDTHKLLFKAIPNRRNDREKTIIDVYNIQTTSGTYIANGFPVHNCGKFSVIWGSKGSCKSTLCYEIVANAQKLGKACIWVDFERSYSPVWAAVQGVNTEDLIVAPAFENAESAMDTVISLMKTKAVDVIILDSIQGMSPMGEQTTKKGVEKSLADDTMALIAKKLSQFFRVSAFQVWESDVTFVLIGQTRTDLGGFIALDRLSGGNALEHWSSFTMHARRGAKALWPYVMADSNEDEPLGEDDEIVETTTGGENQPTIKSKRVKKYTGFAMVARVDKSKVGADEGKEANLMFEYGRGIVT